MSLLIILNEKSLAARKARNTEVATLLNCVLSDSLKIGKDSGNREPTQSEIIKVIKKYQQTAKENFSLTQLEKYKREEEYLITLLPKQLDRFQLRDAIATAIEQYEKNSDTKVNKVGFVMKALKEKYDGLFDPKEASLYINEQSLA
jgi:uncharacterized protein YqeY